MPRHKRKKGKQARKIRAKEREEQRAQSFIELAARPVVQNLPQGDLTQLSPMAQEIARRWNALDRFEEIRRL